MRKKFWYCQYCIHRDNKEFGRNADGLISSWCKKRKEYLTNFEWCGIGEFTPKAIRDNRPQQLGFRRVKR